MGFISDRTNMDPRGKSLAQGATAGIVPGLSKKTSRKIVDPLNLSKSGSGDKPEKTAEELALERRTQMALDKSIGQQESMLKALSRGTLGRASLLSGSPKTSSEASSGGYTGGTRGGVGSLLGGGPRSGGGVNGGGRINGGAKNNMRNK